MHTDKQKKNTIFTYITETANYQKVSKRIIVQLTWLILGIASELNADHLLHRQIHEQSWTEVYWLKL